MIVMGSRRFFVKLDDAGNVRAITERKTFAPGTPYASLYDAPYWHHSQPRPKRGMVANIFDEIERKREQDE